MSYNYRTRNEFMDAYTNGTLSDFNNELYEDYIYFNFDSDDLFDDYNVELKYKNGCDCIDDCETFESIINDFEPNENTFNLCEPCNSIANTHDICDNMSNDIKLCDCGDDVWYFDDKFMWDKIPMSPKNMKFQKYYDEIFPKRIVKNKIFYYLPTGCKTMYTTYIDKTIVNTFDIQRSISYIFINDELVLVQDKMDGWFGSIFQNYHTPESKHFIKYMDKLKEYQNNNELTDNNFYYSVRIID